MEEWEASDAEPTTLDDIDRAIHDRCGELMHEITALQLEIEEQRWWRWGVAIAIGFVLWKLYR